MPRNTFSGLHKRRKSNVEDVIERTEELEFIDDEQVNQDLSSFSPQSQREALFRLNLLRNILLKCEGNINIKAIEPLRVGLQRQFKENIPSSITIYRWWLKYRQSDYNIVSLVPKTRKRGNRSIKVPEVVSNFIDQSVSYVVSSKKINIYSAFRRVRRKVRIYNLNHGTQYKYPKYESIRKRVKKITPYEKLVARKGERFAKREFRRMGKKILTSNVLERVEIDHTVIDLFVVHDVYREAIGRPYLTQLIDCYSKSVIGFYLGFEPPSYVSIALALKNAIQPKDRLLEKFPLVKNEWICFGIPDLIVTDNGKDFLSEAFGMACESLLINIHQCKVETPDNKPNVERQYGKMNTSLLDDLPGKAFSNYLLRDGYDSMDEATLTLNEFTEIYLIWLVDIYQKKKNKRGTNCPNIAWRNGVKEWEPDEFEGSDEDLDFHFAVLKKSILNKQGIRLWEELYYSSDRLAEYRGVKGNHLITYKYNPENMGFIWVLDEDKEEYFKVPAIDYEYASTVSFWVHKQIIKMKDKLYSSEYNEDSEVDAEIRIEDIVDEAQSSKKVGIRQKRRGARFQEGVDRAKTGKETHVIEDSSVKETTHLKELDDSDWDIDYV